MLAEISVTILHRYQWANVLKDIPVDDVNRILAWARSQWADYQISVGSQPDLSDVKYTSMGQI